MARNLQEVKESVHKFKDFAVSQFPIRKVLLYGSYAKGTPRPDSDIDVAVFIDDIEHKNRIELGAKLFHLAADVDIDIEPKCFFWDEYKNYNSASILAEIIRTGIEID